jgi:trigger factor
MRIAVETTGELGRKVTVAIPADQVEQEIANRLKRLSRTVKMPGFRPGRVPLKIIEAKYGPQVLQEVAGQLIESSLRDALTQEGLHPAGGPEIEPKSLNRGSDLEYVASFDVFPEIKKLDLQGVSVERPVYEVTDADVDKTVASMRKQRVEWRAVERSAEKGDRVRIDFHGTVDGEPFPGNEAKDYPVVLGEANVLEDFSQGLYGVETGTGKTITVHFPEEYQGKEVAGKQVDFQIEVLDVCEPVLPEVNEEFAKSFGITDGSVEKMRREVRDNLTSQGEEQVAQIVRGRVMQALIDANHIDLPGQLVRQEVQRMLEADRSMREHQGVSVAEEPDPAQFESEARRRVALGLIVYEVVNANNLKPDKKQVRARIEKMAASYEDPQAFVQWYYGDRKRLEQVESAVLEEQVVETLLATASVKDQPSSFDGLMYGPESTNI